VILFDNAGISSSAGEVPTTVEGMAANAAAFIKALGLKQVDLLGFSIGGTVTKALTLRPPRLDVLVRVATHTAINAQYGSSEGGFKWLTW
jgi:pimeloyl-ACP methyl ester carboxylesterase